MIPINLDAVEDRFLILGFEESKSYLNSIFSLDTICSSPAIDF